MKRKARICLPDSGNFIGVVDPYNVLEEGEIFIQIRKDSFKCSTAKNDIEWERSKAEHAMNSEA